MLCTRRGLTTIFCNPVRDWTRGPTARVRFPLGLTRTELVRLSRPWEGLHRVGRGTSAQFVIEGSQDLDGFLSDSPTGFSDSPPARTDADWHRFILRGGESQSPTGAAPLGRLRSGPCLNCLRALRLGVGRQGSPDTALGPPDPCLPPIWFLGPGTVYCRSESWNEFESRVHMDGRMRS